MLFVSKSAHPRIIWRNPTPPRGRRRTEYRDTVREGRKYGVLERACGYWVLVMELTVVDGRRDAVA